MLSPLFWKFDEIDEDILLSLMLLSSVSFAAAIAALFEKFWFIGGDKVSSLQFQTG